MKKRNFMLSVLICSSIIVSNAVPAFAYETFGYEFNGGVNDLAYRLVRAPEISSTARDAASSWNNSNCGVSLTKSNSTESDIQIYYDEDFTNQADDDKGVIGFTKFYLPKSSKWVGGDNDGHSGPTDNWLKVHIMLNPSVYDAQTDDVKQGTIAHELGHAFGLAHCSDTSALMYKSRGQSFANTPQEDDINGVKSIYGSSTDSVSTLTSSKTLRTTGSAVITDNSDFSYIVTEEDCIENYTDINKLTNVSDTIIQGEIQDTKSCFDKGGIYTDVKIKVTNSLAGSLKLGNVITVRLKGGTLTGNDAKEFRKETIKEWGNNSNNVSSEKIEEVTDGLSNFNKGNNAIFFLNYSNNKYHVTGSHQGRFKLIDDSVQVSEDFKKDSVQVSNQLKYNVQASDVKDESKSIKKMDFIKGIENALLNKK